MDMKRSFFFLFFTFGSCEMSGRGGSTRFLGVDFSGELEIISSEVSSKRSI